MNYIQSFNLLCKHPGGLTAISEFIAKLFEYVFEDGDNYQGPSEEFRDFISIPVETSVPADLLRKVINDSEIELHLNLMRAALNSAEEKSFSVSFAQRVPLEGKQEDFHQSYARRVC